jgi:precorrin-6B methylase 1
MGIIALLALALAASRGKVDQVSGPLLAVYLGFDGTDANGSDVWDVRLALYSGSKATAVVKHPGVDTLAEVAAVYRRLGATHLRMVVIERMGSPSPQAFAAAASEAITQVQESSLGVSVSGEAWIANKLVREWAQA